MQCTRLAHGITVAMAITTGAFALEGGEATGNRWIEHFDGYTGALNGQGGWESWEGGAAGADFSLSGDVLRGETLVLKIDGDDDAVRVFSPDDLEGAYGFAFSTYVYVPTSFAGSQYFILLNTYQAAEDNDWSLQLEIDGVGGVFRDFDDTGNTMPLPRDEWIHIDVVVDLESDQQSVFLDDQLFIEKSWSAGVAPGGDARLQAVDLWANGSASPVYYDSFFLEPFLPIPACTTDVDNDGVTGFNDLLQVLATWGACDLCPEDVDGNGAVDFDDLLMVLAAWGPCPRYECGPTPGGQAFLDADGQWRVPDFDGLDSVDPWHINRDGYAAPLAVTQSPAAGTVFAGEQTVSLDVTITDSGGANDSCGTTIELIDATVPTIEITGVIDGQKYVAPVVVTPVITATDAVDPAPAVAATLNGLPFTSGTPVSDIGHHTLRVAATDAAGLVATRTLHFEICQFPQLPVVPVVVALATGAGPAEHYSLETTIYLASPEFDVREINLYSLGLWALNEDGLPLNERPIPLVGSQGVDGGYDYSTVDAWYENGYYVLHFAVDVGEANLSGIPVSLELTGTGLHTQPGEFEFTASTPAMVNPDPLGFLAASGLINGDPFEPPPVEPQWAPCKWRMSLVRGPIDTDNGMKDTSCRAANQFWRKELLARALTFFGDALAHDWCWGNATTAASAGSYAIMRVWLEGPADCCNCEITEVFLPKFDAEAKASSGQALAGGLIDIVSSTGCAARAVGAVQAGAAAATTVTFGGGATVGPDGPEAGANVEVQTTLVGGDTSAETFTGIASCQTQVCSVTIAMVCNARLNVSADGYLFFQGSAHAWLRDATPNVTVTATCTATQGPCAGLTRTFTFK